MRGEGEEGGEGGKGREMKWAMLLAVGVEGDGCWVLGLGEGSGGELCGLWGLGWNGDWLNERDCLFLWLRGGEGVCY